MSNNLLYPYLNDIYASQPSAPSVSEYNPEFNKEGMQYCFFCKRLVDEDDALIKQICNHQYHLDCGMYWISTNGQKCPNCTIPKFLASINNGQSDFSIPESGTYFMPISNNNQVEEEEQIDEGIPIDHGNNPEVTRNLEMRFGKQGKRFVTNSREDISKKSDQDEYSRKEIKFTMGQRIFFYGMKLAMSNNEKPVIDIDFINEKGLFMKDLITIGISVNQLYSLIGARTWDELIELGIEKEHIDKLGLQKLMNMYGIRYDHMKQIGIDVKFLSTEIKPESIILSGLGLDFESLIDNGMDIDDIINFEYPVKEWKDFLGMRKEHLFKLDNNVDAIRGILKDLSWKFCDVRSEFGLNEKEIERLKIKPRIKKVKEPIKQRTNPIVKKTENKTFVQKMEVVSTKKTTQKKRPEIRPEVYTSRLFIPNQ